MKPKLFVLLLTIFATTNCISQKQGQEKIDSLLFVLKNENQDTVKVNCLNALAEAFGDINPDTAIILGKQALVISKHIGWEKGVGLSFHEIGWNYFLMGNYVISLQYYSDAIQLWEKLEKNANISQRSMFKTNRAISFGSIGSVYSAKGDYPKALDYFLKALRIDEESNNKNGIARSFGNIGIVYQAQGDFDKALEYYFKSLKIYKESGNKSLIATSLDNIGIIYSIKGDFEKAREYFFEAMNIDQSIRNKNGIARHYGNIGITYDSEDNYKNALDYYLKALNLSEEIEDKKGTAIWSCNIGALYTTTKEYSKAESYLLKSLLISENIKALDLIRENQSALSELYSETGNSKKALEYYKSSIALKDSIFNDTKKKEISQLELNYENEKNDAKAKLERVKQRSFQIYIGLIVIALVITLLLSFRFYNRKLDLVKKQKEAVQSFKVAELEMKSLRSQMNPHFIFNALQSIQTFLMSHKQDDANTYLIKFSKLMRLVLENSQYSEVSLKLDLQALELYMQLESIRLPHPFTYEFHIDENVDEETTTIPPLILQPFVENAIWHGLQYKTEPGHINIYISKKDNALFATVEDNGVGRDMSKQVQKPMLLKKESLGMKLTEERLKILNELKKIKSQFKITDLFTKDNQPAGTRVDLSLPIVA